MQWSGHVVAGPEAEGLQHLPYQHCRSLPAGRFVELLVVDDCSGLNWKTDSVVELQVGYHSAIAVDAGREDKACSGKEASLTAVAFVVETVQVVADIAGLLVLPSYCFVWSSRGL